MQATYNLVRSLNFAGLVCSALMIPLAMLSLVAFSPDFFDDYLWGWPLGISVAVAFSLVAILPIMMRDQKVTITRTPKGLVFRDEAVGYCREDLIPYEHIKGIKVRYNPFFKSLTIYLKDSNQRFFLSNATLPKHFVKHVKAEMQRTAG